MNTCEKQYLNNPFSHIYLENDLFENPTAKSILAHFKGSKVISVSHYKDVFNRKNQNFALQKASQSLIIAKKTNELVYKGAPFCQSFGSNRFYYTSFVLNCLYDCEYCYLRGMYPGGNIAVFVNCEDFFDEIVRIAENKEIFLCVSYDTDLLALEPVLGFCKKWYYFARQNPNINVELRTKCANTSFLTGLTPIPNFIQALTLTPNEIAEAYEHKTPSLAARLNAADKILQEGFPLRISLDPVLYVNNFEEIYTNFINTLADSINLSLVKDVAFGSFRISPGYLKAMRKNYPNSAIAAYPFQNVNGACSYPQCINTKITDFVYSRLEKVLPKNKIYMWKP